MSHHVPASPSVSLRLVEHRTTRTFADTSLTVPVKPRPQGPPQGAQNGRPMGPRTSSSNAMAPRPLTPNGDGRPRSQTLEREQKQTMSPPAQEDGLRRSFSLTAARVPARKPVPGQAL